jgi:hypothetical protein
LLTAEHIFFMFRIFLQDRSKTVALLQVGTLETMLIPAIDGADADGTLIQAPTPRAFGMGEKPLQAPAEFRQGETLVSPEAMGPPPYPELIHEAFHLGKSFSKFRVVQLAMLT